MASLHQGAPKNGEPALEVAHIVEAGGRGQLQQGDGRLGVCREGLLHAGVLPFQVWAELLQGVQEDGPGHAECPQPLLIVQDQMHM